MDQEIKRYKRYVNGYEEIPRSTLRRWEKKQMLGLANDIDAETAEGVGVYASSSSEELESSLPRPTSPIESCSSDASYDSSDFSENGGAEKNGRLLDEAICKSSDLTVGQGIYKIVKFYLRHSLTKDSLHDLIKLIGDFLPQPNKLPHSKYEVLEIIKSLAPASSIKKHQFCESCTGYIGELHSNADNREELTHCPACQSDDVMGIFVEYPLESLIKSAFEDRQLYKIIEKFPIAEYGGTVSDINSCEEYFKLKRDAIPGNYDLTLLWNTDGVPIFKSSNAQLWPLQIVIAEIPYHLRPKFLLVAGLWVGNTKPNMNTFLRPFATSLTKLSTEGVRWLHPRLRKEIVSKVVAPISCVDAPARAAIQNIHQYNGAYGCSHCEHEGVRVPTGDGHCRVYPITDVTPSLRSSVRMQQQALEAVAADNGDHVMGVKGLTVVSLIPHFDLGSSFIPDYMHCLLLGVVRQILFLWVNSSNSSEEWYIGLNVPEIDEHLLSIKVPDILTRAPRSITLRKYWKAAEYRSWLLYYSVPVLKGILKAKYFQHWLLLVSAAQILLGEKIVTLEIDLAESLLKLFVENVVTLYGLRNCSFNVHQLLHISKSVQQWGPLWATSAFVFESGNGTLLNLVHGTQNIGMQLVNSIRIINGLEILSNSFLREGNTIENVTKPLGLPLTRKHMPEFERTAILNLVGVHNELATFSIHSRCIILGETYKSILYTRDRRRNSYTICYTNVDGGTKLFGSIKYFAYVNNQFIVCIVKVLEINRSNMFMNRETTKRIDHIIPIVETNMVHAIYSDSVCCKVIRVGQYVCLRPNTKEVNL